MFLSVSTWGFRGGLRLFIASVRGVVAVAEWPGRKVNNLLQYRLYGLMDDYCGCENCEGRRASGLQGPRKGGKKDG